MLTDSEKRWLERRKIYANVNCWSHFSCQWCEQLNVNREGYRTPCGASIYGCPHVDMEVDNDDIEFEERVAVKLAKHIYDKPLECETNCDCPYWPQGECAWCYLKAARLEVEEEMDNEP